MQVAFVPPPIIYHSLSQYDSLLFNNPNIIFV